MAGSNKQKANSLCPMIDFGVPKGDVWVITKKAVLPYHIVEMGDGPDALARLKTENAALAAARPQVSNRRRAVDAFSSGMGTLLDQLYSDPVIDIHTSVKDLQREKLLHGDYQAPTLPKRLWQAFKAACKDVWDGAQEQD